MCSFTRLKARASRLVSSRLNGSARKTLRLKYTSFSSSGLMSGWGNTSRTSCKPQQMLIPNKLGKTNKLDCLPEQISTMNRVLTRASLKCNEPLPTLDALRSSCRELRLVHVCCMLPVWFWADTLCCFSMVWYVWPSAKIMQIQPLEINYELKSDCIHA